MWRRAAGLLLLGGLLVFESACPRARCAAIDKPTKDTLSARCIALACPVGAKEDGAGGCVCDDGATPFFGACMGRETLPRYCGASARPAEAGCALVPCSPTEVLDRTSGICLPVGSQRSIAKAMSVGLYEDETLGCDADAILVARDNNAACAPVAQTCGLGTRSKPDGGCVPLPACGAGTVYSAIDDRCVRVVSELDGAPLVDVAQWMRASFGADGGVGTTAVCSVLRADRRFGTTTEDDVVLGLEVRLRGNEITEAELRVEATLGIAPSETARTLVDHALRPLVDALRSMGGLGNAATATTRVHCPLHLWGRPHAIPVASLGADAGAPAAPPLDAGVKR